MSGKIRKSKEKNGEVVAFSESAMRHNGAVLEYIRTSVSVLVSGAELSSSSSNFIGPSVRDRWSSGIQQGILNNSIIKRLGYWRGCVHSKWTPSESL